MKKFDPRDLNKLQSQLYAAEEDFPQIFISKYFDNCSDDELARIYDLTKSEVANRLKRIKVIVNNFFNAEKEPKK